MYSMNVAEIPTLASYQSALTWWGRTHQWRRAEPGMRALTKRPKRTKTLVRYDDGRIAARLHDTDLVTYYEDGRIQLTRYDSASSAMFIQAVVPYGLGASFVRKQLWFTAASDWYQAQHPAVTTRPHPVHSLTFRQAEGSPTRKWVLADPENAKRHSVLHLNRAKAKDARQRIDTFTKWVTAIHALNGNDMTELVDVREPRASDHRDETPLFQLMDDPGNVDLYPKALVNLCSARFKFDTPVPGQPTEARMKRVYMLDWDWEKKLTRAAYKAADAFREVEVPLGTLPPADKWRK